MKNYKNVDMAEIREWVYIAEDIVADTIKKENIVDYGTCVLGAGIKINFIWPRCRKPRERILISQPFQGNVSNYRALKTALDYLQSKGVDCFYDDGRVDLGGRMITKEQLEAWIEKKAIDHATSPLGFSGRDHFDSHEYINFRGGAMMMLSMILMLSDGLQKLYYDDGIGKGILDDIAKMLEEK
jgi:hypothetical protein